MSKFDQKSKYLFDSRFIDNLNNKIVQKKKTVAIETKYFVFPLTNQE